MSFSENQISLLKSTWAPIEGAYEETGIAMYTKLFTDNPDLLPLFKFTENLPIPQMVKSKRFLRHAKGVIRTVGTAVEGTADEQALVKKLRTLAARHVSYGAKTDMFGPVGAALLHAIETQAGSKWTPEAKNAWVSFYEYITAIMSEAMTAAMAGK